MAAHIPSLVRAQQNGGRVKLIYSVLLHYQNKCYASKRSMYVNNPRSDKSFIKLFRINVVPLRILKYIRRHLIKVNYIIANISV